MPALTVHNAELKTAAVEVKTLTISGKQVTQAVFRQLQEEGLISRVWTFRGIPWGRVNYHPDEECKQTGPHATDRWGKKDYYCTANHIHVVWQLNTELRRTLIWDVCDCPWRSWQNTEEDYAWDKEQRKQVYATLSDLPQLFIAV